eukprot:1156788-Pelagomonas_calceolata.AAC.11
MPLKEPLIELGLDSHTALELALKLYAHSVHNTRSFSFVRNLKSNFLLQCNKKLFYVMSELLHLMLAGMDQPQADQPNNPVEGLPFVFKAKASIN